MKFDPKADPVLETGVKSFEINYFCTFRFTNLIFMALMNLWNLNDVEMCMARVIANVIFTMQVKCHSLSVLSMCLYGLCKNVLVTCVLRICYISTFCICSFWTLWRNRLDSGKVQVGEDQEKAQSEKDSHSKNRGGKNQTNNQVLIPWNIS